MALTNYCILGDGTNDVTVTLSDGVSTVDYCFGDSGTAVARVNYTMVLTNYCILGDANNDVTVT